MSRWVSTLFLVTAVIGIVHTLADGHRWAEQRQFNEAVVKSMTAAATAIKADTCSMGVDQ